MSQSASLIGLSIHMPQLSSSMMPNSRYSSMRFSKWFSTTLMNAFCAGVQVVEREDQVLGDGRTQRLGLLARLHRRRRLVQVFAGLVDAANGDHHRATLEFEVDFQLVQRAEQIAQDEVRRRPRTGRSCGAATDN